MKAIILGASGLVGNELLQKLIASERFSEIVVFVRRPLDIKNHKIKQIISELDNLSNYENEFHNTDALFCCLGTTIKKAKSKENFKKVDYTYPLDAAKIFKQQNGKHFIVITALGSNSGSRFLYNKTKGELEDALKELNLNRLSIIRPSLLLGDRNEKRFLEDISKLIFPIVNLFIPEKYKPVQGSDVAEMMLQTSLGQSCPKEIEVETI